MILELDIEWPSTIPLPRVEYAGEPSLPTLFPDAKSANLERRARFERSYATAIVQWELTDAQYTAFKTFFGTTLSNGTAQFKLELRFPKNSELTAWAVRISDGYAVAHEEGMWKVQAGLDIINPVNF